MSGQTHAVCAYRGSGSSIVFLPQTACSAIVHVFDRCRRDRKSLFSAAFYNADALRVLRQISETVLATSRKTTFQAKCAAAVFQGSR